ncbi:hypothetical protein [Prevotella sp. P4-119]|uniref:hypothetical protein n=1 Tax=Prevotella sp. P4-119 TaxID=2024218 RepID=UPI0020B159EE|nr:hypothetical protein [Prevotella sp. P4-119]
MSEPLAFYMMDKAYVDFLALYRFHKAGAYWISRPKDNMRYEVTDHRHDFEASTGICGDFTIKLTTHKSKSPYSITKVATLIRISALERIDLRDLITKPKDSIIQNQNVKELTLFDEF